MKFVCLAFLLAFLATFPEGWNRSGAHLASAHQRQSLKQTISIINDRFVTRTYDQELIYSKIRSKYPDLPVHKKVVANIHWPEINDTLLTLYTSQDTFRFYHAQDKIMLYYMSLGSSKITIGNNLKVGAPAHLLKTKFKLKSVPANLLVKVLEGGLAFNFKQNREKTKIDRINFEAELD